MLKHWTKLVNTDCVVIGIGERLLYPIYRNGSTSLTRACDRQYINNQITALNHIDVIIRDPVTRFVSGINEYSRQHKIDVPQVCELIKHENLVDRHFSPQYVWLCHLYRFFKGTVTLRPLTAISDYCDNHFYRSKSTITVQPVKEFVEIDYRLLEQLDQKQKLQDIIERYKNVLS
jgi:hypothetical protein